LKIASNFFDFFELGSNFGDSVQNRNEKLWNLFAKIFEKEIMKHITREIFLKS